MMQSEVLPKELQLVTPPALPQARSYMFKQQSELQEYDVSKNNRIRINIPRLQRSYLMKDSYIRFRLNLDFTVKEDVNATRSAIWFDRCGAFGLFDRIEVYDYLGGTLLEQTQNIPALATMLQDLNTEITKFSTTPEATQGAYGAVTLALPGYLRTANTGMALSPRTNTVASHFGTYEFCLPLMSFLGNFSDKYAPLHNGYSIDFFLNSKELAFISRSNVNDTVSVSATIDEAWISNFEMCCQVIELGEQAESILTASEPMVIPSSQYRYFRDLILGNASQSSFNVPLNLNVVSLRDILWAMRPTRYQGFAYPSYGHRMRNFLTNWNFQYGSSYLPEIAGITTRSISLPTSRKGNAPINNDYNKAAGYTQSYMEFLKSVPNQSTSVGGLEYMVDTGVEDSTVIYDSSIYAGSLVNDVPTYWSGMCGKFACGLTTRLSDKSTISGIDTNGLSVSLNGYFDSNGMFDATTSNLSKMEQAIVDIWAEHDAFIQIIPGVATTVTF